MHWVDGGETDLCNAALLCERHHVVVHSRRYAGHVVHGQKGDRIEWDLTYGSYDRLLAVQVTRRTSVTLPRTPPSRAGPSGCPRRA